MKKTQRVAPGYEEDEDVFEDASEQAFINPEEEFYEGKNTLDFFNRSRDRQPLESLPLRCA